MKEGKLTMTRAATHMHYGQSFVKKLLTFCPSVAKET